MLPTQLPKKIAFTNTLTSREYGKSNRVWRLAPGDVGAQNQN